MQHEGQKKEDGEEHVDIERALAFTTFVAEVDKDLQVVNKQQWKKTA